MPLRVTVFRAVVEARLKYGGEVLGMNKRLTNPLQKVMNMGIRALVGYRTSRNTRLALGPAGIELNIPPLAASMAAARARALIKYATLRTHIAGLLSTPSQSGGRRSWSTTTASWLKKYKCLVEGVTPRAIKTLVSTRVVQRDAGKTQALETYKTNCYEDTRKYHRSDLWAMCSRGYTWVARLRLGAVWTCASAGTIGLISKEAVGKCPSCGMRTTTELAHVLINCPKFKDIRDESGLTSLIVKSKKILEADSEEGVQTESDLYIILLGGEVREVSLGPEWSGERTQKGGPRPTADAASVARFVSQAMPTYMGNLWAHRLEDKG